MKKLLRISTLALFFTTTLIFTSAQSFSVALSLPGAELRHSHSRILDDGSVISIVFDQNNSSSHVVKITTDGTTAWAKMYQGIRIDDIQQLPSGNLAIVGTKDYYYSVWGLLDQNGNQLWANQLYSFDSNYDLASLDILASGRILCSFSKYSKNITVRCDELGNTEGCDEGGDTSVWKNPRFDSFGCGDSGYVGCSKRDDRIMITRHNANGDLLWAKDYLKSTTEYFHIKKIKELQDGNFIGVGLVSDTYTGPNNSGFIIKLDSNGEVLWTNKYPLPSNPGYFSSTFRNFEIEGSFIYISGYYTTDNLNMNNFLIKMDDSGNIIESKQMVTSTNLLNWGLTPSMGTVTFEQDMKNHYLVYNNYGGGEGTLNVEINKTSFDGPLGCEVVNFPLNAVSYAAVTNTQPAMYYQTSILATAPETITPVSLVITTSSLGMNDACASLAGIDEDHLYDLTVYPNPASEILTVSGLDADHEYTIQMIDLTGKVIQTNAGISGVNITTIQVGSISLGSYVLNVTDIASGLFTQLKWMKM